MSAIDLATLDHQAARAHAAVVRERARLATEDGRDDARAIDPFSGVREVAGQTTFVALASFDAGPVHSAHRAALQRWAHALVETRVAWELLIDEADAIHAPDPELSRFAGDPAAPVQRTFHEAFRALVEAPHLSGAELALRRLDELAASVAAVRKEIHARRFEVARRLGLSHPWALASGGDAAKLAELAGAVLDATEPLAAELHRDLRRRNGTLTAAHTIHDAFGRDAREGWPAHLGSRWLEDVFRALAPRPPRAMLFPTVLGGATFLRAASAWGAALRLGGIARSLPFALARDPQPTEAWMLGDALAVAVADRVFAKRKLGLPNRSADAHARVLGRSLFVSLRKTAADLLNGMQDPVQVDGVEERGARVFGAPLPSALAAAWSYGGIGGHVQPAPAEDLRSTLAASGSSRFDAPARLLGAVRAHGFVRSLIERFDEDWFDNPRAGAHVASVSVGPIWQGDVPEIDAVRALARAFEETLG
jgi:hypothetical protein